MQLIISAAPMLYFFVFVRFLLIFSWSISQIEKKSREFVYLKERIKMCGYGQNVNFTPNIYAGLPAEVWLLREGC